MRTPTLPLVRAVLAEAWRLLPAIKVEAAIRRIRLSDLGAVHGRYHPDSGVLELNPRMFGGDRTHFIDDQGLERPYRGPAVSRALHTTLHEIAHAIGEATGLDRRRAWLELSGWQDTSEDAFGYSRYEERRPGWEPGPSAWRHRRGTFFCRVYSSKSPYEDFADCLTYRALGWTHVFTRLGNGQRKLAYVNRYVWGDASATAAFFGPGSLHTQAVRRRRAVA